MAEPMINLYPLLSASTHVTHYVADRIYPTVAPQHAKPPFVVWQLVSNVAYNSLSCTPDADSQRIQIDCYAAKPVTARDLAFVVRDCLQATGNVIDGPVPMMEQDTGLHRWTLDAVYFHKRSA